MPHFNQSQRALMKGKTTVVSGSLAGIGTAIAEKLSMGRANIVLNCPFPQLLAECEQVGAKMQTPWISVCADMSTVWGPAALVPAAVARFKQIDILVSNAGMIQLGPLGEANADTWDQALNLNSRGAFLLVKAALPCLTPFESLAKSTAATLVHSSKRGGFRIIIVSSFASRMPEVNQSIYAASKGTLDAMIRVWARELPPVYRCTVKAVAPGSISTETFFKIISSRFNIVKQEMDLRTSIKGAFGDVENVALTVAFLAEERSQSINGEYLLLTGSCYINWLLHQLIVSK
ncbi:3-oxoacyl-(acyl-carrier protein) reductase [Colletotrichum acutatum]